MGMKTKNLITLSVGVLVPLREDVTAGAAQSGGYGLHCCLDLERPLELTAVSGCQCLGTGA